MIAGESGLVYRGYVKRGQCNELVAIKTGKGSTHTIELLCSSIVPTTIAKRGVGLGERRRSLLSGWPLRVLKLMCLMRTLMW